MFDCDETPLRRGGRYREVAVSGGSTVVHFITILTHTGKPVVEPSNLFLLLFVLSGIAWEVQASPYPTSTDKQQ